MRIIIPDSGEMYQMGDVSLFLAGSIESNVETTWRDRVISELVSYDDSLVLFNPSNDKWTASSTEAFIRKQIKWELEKQDESDIIFFYFDPKSVSPISLLELGMALKDYDKSVIVVCNKEYSKYLNVEMTCRHYGFNSICQTLEDGINELKVLINFELHEQY